MSDIFDFSVKEGIATLIFDMVGQKVNKLSKDAFDEFVSILDTVEGDKSIRALVIKSAKPGIFIAGADIHEIKEIGSREEGYKKAKGGQDVLNRLESLPCITVAAINGATLGGGLEFVLACDYRVVSNHVKSVLGLPEVSLGIIPGFGGTQRLPRLIGLDRALPMILSGKPVKARKAFTVGLVDALYQDAFFDECVERFVASLSDSSFVKKINRRRQIKGFVRVFLNYTFIGRIGLYYGAKKSVLKKTKGHYPAPLLALKAAIKGFPKSLSKGLLLELDYFASIAHTPICKTLVGLFFLQEDLKRYKGVDGDFDIPDVSRVGVLGAGVMGGGISWLFSYRGMKVRMKDINWDSILKGFSVCKEIFDGFIKRRRLRPFQSNFFMNQISGALDYSGFKHMDVVVEAIVENMDVKKKVLAELEKNVSQTAILASNTSSLSITEMAKGLTHPERCVGMHFFNPVNLMPLVEVVPGEATSDQTVARMVHLVKRLKKTPLVVKDCPGFLVNRVLLPGLMEAFYLLHDGVDLQRIDACSEAFGMPMGPFVVADAVGFDVCYKVAKELERGYGDRMAVPDSCERFYERGDILGKKTGRGFYIYTGKKKTINPDVVSIVHHYSVMANVDLGDNDIVDRLILIQVNEAVRCLDEGVIENHKLLDMAMIMGCGFPPFRGGLCRYVDERGIGNVYDSMNRLAERFGDRFVPCDLIKKMASSNGCFYSK